MKQKGMINIPFIQAKRRLFFTIFYLICLYVSPIQGASEVLLDKVIITIDEQVILQSELIYEYEQALAQEQEKGDLLKSQILENLIISKMLLAEAYKKNIQVPTGDIERLVQQQFHFLVQKAGSKEQLTHYCKKSSFAIKKDLKHKIKEMYLIDAVKQEITKSITVIPMEVKMFFNKIIPHQRPYYASSFKIRHLVKYPAINEKIRDTVIKQLQSLKKRIVSGTSFEELVRTYSEDQNSVSQGGELGFVPIGTLASAYEKAVLALKPGEISDPITTECGIHLIQLLDKRKTEFNSRHILIIPQPSDEDLKLVTNNLNRLRTAIVEKNITFEQAVREYSQDAITVTQGGLLSNINQNRVLLMGDELPPEVFFIVDKMQPGEVSLPIPYKGADNKVGVRIFFLEEKVGPHEMNLGQDYEKIYHSLVEEKKINRLKEWVKEVKNDFEITIDPSCPTYALFENGC